MSISNQILCESKRWTLCDRLSGQLFHSVDIYIHLLLHVPMWSIDHIIYLTQNCERIKINLCFQNVYLAIKYYPLHSKIKRYWIRHLPPPFALASISQFDISTNIYSHIAQPKRRHPLSILPTLWILGPAKENFIPRKILEMANTDMRWNALGPSPVDLTLDGNNQDSHDINKKVKCRCLSRHILEFVLVRTCVSGGWYTGFLIEWIFYWIESSQINFYRTQVRS